MPEASHEYQNFSSPGNIFRLDHPRGEMLKKTPTYVRMEIPI